MELSWVNPHVSLLVKGIVDGDATTEEEWLMEMTSPGNLVRAGGWSRNAVKAGDRVVVDFSPLRDTSSRGGALKKVTLVDTGQRPSRPTSAPRKCPASSSSGAMPASRSIVRVLAALGLSAAGSIASAQNEAAPPPRIRSSPARS